MSKPKLTNVKKHLEHVGYVILEMLANHNETFSGGIYLPPLYREELEKIMLINSSILRNHQAKKTRKDVYVNRG